MVVKMPRVVIIGAGMAGITAAFQLQLTSCFDVAVLEASHRIGGRICTSQVGGDLVELGATWIHGIEGSPVYAIAQRIGSLKGDMPWERQDGFPRVPVVRAEGGLAVDSDIVEPVKDLYRKMMLDIRTEEKLEKHDDGHQHARSIGTFLRQAFDSFLSQRSHVMSDDKERFPGRDDVSFEQLSPPESSGWTLRSLQDAAFSIYENMERIITSANSLCDLDLESEHEYKEYPGDQITIGKGYISVLKELASYLPAGTIRFGKKVQNLVWNRSSGSNAPVLIHCSDGSLVEADHVIVTVSLGVLKAGVLPANVAEECEWADRTDGPVCKSISDLKHGPRVGETMHALFEPPLPPHKVEAISRLGYGVVDKLFLLLNSSRKEQLRSHIELMYKKEGVGNEESRCPWWMRKTTSVAPIYEGSDVLLLWFAGEEAMEMERLSDEEIMRGVEETLAKFGVVKKTSRNNGCSSRDSEESCGEGVEKEAERLFKGVMRSRWGRSPLYEGSYSFVARGSSGGDIDRVAEAVHGHETPLQLLFAGEATDRHFYSTTHGAHRSGLREAHRLIRHYGFPLEAKAL